MLISQTDKLIISAIQALDGPDEAKVVTQLLRFRDELSGRTTTGRSDEVEALRSETMDAVNDYFHRRLIALPAIAEFLDKVAAEGEAH